MNKSREFADVSSNNGEFGYDAHTYAEHSFPHFQQPPFIVIKATEGTGYVNPYHAAWVGQSHAAKLAVGHYHFARPNGNPIAECNWFWSRVFHNFGHGGRDFLILDLETPQLHAQTYMVEFESELKRIASRHCIKYTGEAYYKENGLHSNYPKWWIANYSHEPHIEQELWAWQFTETGRHRGINGNTDLSRIMSPAAIQYWCKS